MKKTTPSLILAHRGDSIAFAENTMQAFESAFAVGADGLEIDIQLSKDHEIVVIHDETVNRVSDGKGWVGDLNYAELSKLNVAHTRPDLSSCHIPRLEEVLELIVGTQKIINIELKDSVRQYPGLAEETLKLVQRLGVENQVIYSSFNHYSMVNVKQLSSEAKTGLLYSSPLYEPWTYAQMGGADALHPDYRNLAIPGYVDSCREQDLMVNVWTVDHEEDIRWMLEAQVDAIITNVPSNALKIRDGSSR